MCEYWYHCCGHETRTACARTRKAEAATLAIKKNENDNDVEKFATYCPGFSTKPKTSCDPCYTCIMARVYQQVRMEKIEVETMKAQLMGGEFGHNSTHRFIENFSSGSTPALPLSIEAGPSDGTPNSFRPHRAQSLTFNNELTEFRPFDTPTRVERSASLPIASGQTQTYNGVPLISTKSNSASPNRAAAASSRQNQTKLIFAQNSDLGNVRGLAAACSAASNSNGNGNSGHSSPSPHPQVKTQQHSTARDTLPPRPPMSSAIPATPAPGMANPSDAFNFANIYGPGVNLGNGSFQPSGYAGYGVGMGVSGGSCVVWSNPDPFQAGRPVGRAGGLQGYRGDGHGWGCSHGYGHGRAQQGQGHRYHG